MKTRFFLLFLMICTSLHAQKNTLRVGGKLLVEFAEYYAAFSPGLGGQVVYQFSKHGSIESGLYQINRGIRFEYIFNLPGQFRNGFATANYYFLQIPFCIRYQFGRTYLAMGLSVDTFLGVHTGTKDSDVNIRVQKYGSFDSSILFSLGRDWKLNQKLSLLTEIRYNAQLSNEQLSNYGLGFGLNYRLR